MKRKLLDAIIDLNIYAHVEPDNDVVGLVRDKKTEKLYMMINLDEFNYVLEEYLKKRESN